MGSRRPAQAAGGGGGRGQGPSHRWLCSHPTRRPRAGGSRPSPHPWLPNTLEGPSDPRSSQAQGPPATALNIGRATRLHPHAHVAPAGLQMLCGEEPASAWPPRPSHPPSPAEPPEPRSSSPRPPAPNRPQPQPALCRLLHSPGPFPGRLVPSHPVPLSSGHWRRRPKTSLPPVTSMGPFRRPAHKRNHPGVQPSAPP